MAGGGLFAGGFARGFASTSGKEGGMLSRTRGGGGGRSDPVGDYTKIENLRINQEELNMKKEEHQLNMDKMGEEAEKRRTSGQIDAQFIQQTQQNGLSGGVDFLLKVDPARGLAMQKQIEETKKSVYDTLKAKADAIGANVDNEKKMKELRDSAIDSIAGFGQELSRVPEAQKEQVFKQMLPELQKLDRNFPTNFNQAKVYFMGANGLAIPANKRYTAEQDYNKAQSNEIKAIEYLRRNPDLSKEDKRAVESQRDKLITEQVDAEDKRIRAMLRGNRNAEMAMRKEYTGLVKTNIQMNELYSRGIKMAKLATPIGDHALVVAYVKMGDATSVAMEGEQVSVRNAGKMSPEMQRLWNLTANGTELGGASRKQLLQAINVMKETNDTKYNLIRERYVGIAMKSGLDVDQAIPDYAMRKEDNKRAKVFDEIPDEYKASANAALERGVPPEEVLKHWQAKSQETLKSGSPEEAKAMADAIARHQAARNGDPVPPKGEQQGQQAQGQSGGEVPEEGMAQPDPDLAQEDAAAYGDGT